MDSFTIKEINALNMNRNNNKYNDSITRTRKSRYKDSDLNEYNYIIDENISDEIDASDNDYDINSVKRKKRKINNRTC